MKTVFTAIRGLVYGFLFFLLWWWAADNVLAFDQSFNLTFPSWISIPGVICMAAGGFLALLCLLTFVIHGKGTAAPFDPPRKFVALGPYQYVRNPMYIGGWMVIAGAGLFLSSISLLVLSFIFLLLMHLFVALFEERWLERRFGERYIEYKKSVHRWLPL